MEVITIQSEAFYQIIDKIDSLSSMFKKSKKEQPFNEAWLDISETCQCLKISKRTLQAYRDNVMISFSKIVGKIYFKASDIEEHLNKNYIKAFRK